MKLSKVLLLTLISGAAQSHTQSPTLFGGELNPLEAITLSKETTVPIRLGNLSRFLTTYDILVDEVKVGRTRPVPENGRIQFKVPVSLDMPSSPQTFQICSIAFNDGGMLRTKVCTKAQLIWVDQ
ncbi:hypothetical protein [Vibrio splendidus]|uniref:hypothetical protein n=1 Tax=Vibrio splendidus TaxID=29497 RepID=UPI000D3CB554|nr:hypothetical protein [Vibrio splendidus]PTP50622.1 hypothetical protein CWO05_19965 [Vibrio splendidus]